MGDGSGRRRAEVGQRRRPLRPRGRRLGAVAQQGLDIALHRGRRRSGTLRPARGPRRRQWRPASRSWATAGGRAAGGGSRRASGAPPPPPERPDPPLPPAGASYPATAVISPATPRRAASRWSACPRARSRPRAAFGRPRRARLRGSALAASRAASRSSRSVSGRAGRPAALSISATMSAAARMSARRSSRIGALALPRASPSPGHADPAIGAQPNGSAVETAMELAGVVHVGQRRQDERSQ